MLLGDISVNAGNVSNVSAEFLGGVGFLTMAHVCHRLPLS